MMEGVDRVKKAAAGATAWARDYYSALRKGRIQPYTPVESEARRATDATPWGPHGQTLRYLARETFNGDESCEQIFNIIKQARFFIPPLWPGLECTGKRSKHSQWGLVEG